jgi:hypothetical protein
MLVKKRKPYKGIFYSVFNKIKRQSKERDIPFSVTIQYIGNLFERQKGVCALTGTVLTLKKTSTDKTQTASLDRKDSSKGYIRGNLQWVHKSINKLKSNLQQESFIYLCYQVTKHHKEVNKNKKEWNSKSFLTKSRL